MNKIEITQPELHTFLIQSVRYCLGRMSYAVSDCSDMVHKYWHCLGKGTKDVIHRDIASEIEEHNIMLETERYRRQLEEGYSLILGQECDAFTWLELLSWIESQEKENERN